MSAISGAARKLKSGSSTRFVVFDSRAKIVAEHQTEYSQILPHAGWHEQDPEELVWAMRECINGAMGKLRMLGHSDDSVKGVGTWLVC